MTEEKMATISENEPTTEECVEFIGKHGLDTFFRALEPFSVRLNNAIVDGIHIDDLRQMVLQSGLPLAEISGYLDEIKRVEEKRAKS